MQELDEWTGGGRGKGYVKQGVTHSGDYASVILTVPIFARLRASMMATVTVPLLLSENLQLKKHRSMDPSTYFQQCNARDCFSDAIFNEKLINHVTS
ncbi:unnamed protein product [Camellia sinensis]